MPYAITAGFSWLFFVGVAVFNESIPALFFAIFSLLAFVLAFIKKV